MEIDKIQTYGRHAQKSALYERTIIKDKTLQPYIVKAAIRGATGQDGGLNNGSIILALQTSHGEEVKLDFVGSYQYPLKEDPERLFPTWDLVVQTDKAVLLHESGTTQAVLKKVKEIIRQGFQNIDGPLAKRKKRLYIQYLLTSEILRGVKSYSFLKPKPEGSKDPDDRALSLETKAGDKFFVYFSGGNAAPPSGRPASERWTCKITRNDGQVFNKQVSAASIRKALLAATEPTRILQSNK